MSFKWRTGVCTYGCLANASIVPEGRNKGDCSSRASLGGYAACVCGSKSSRSRYKTSSCRNCGRQIASECKRHLIFAVPKYEVWVAAIRLPYLRALAPHHAHFRPPNCIQSLFPRAFQDMQRRSYQVFSSYYPVFRCRCRMPSRSLEYEVNKVGYCLALDFAQLNFDLLNDQTYCINRLFV
jgi:hypothetical protein